MATADYQSFIRSKSQWHNDHGIKVGSLPSFLYDFQAHLVEWSLRKGRAAIFADCGLGKGPMQLVWADQVVKHTNKPVIVLTPIAVGQQMMIEADKFGITAKRSRDGSFDGDKCVWVTNYEQLHKFNPLDFGGCSCDESSSIKDFKSQRKQAVVEFMRKMEFRLLCTATAAPNDYWELGTSSEALGYLGFRDMITKFFKQEQKGGHHGWGRTKYRFRGHAEQPFWSWVCSWARSLRSPSDIGFDGKSFELPPLYEVDHQVEARSSRDDLLFDVPAVGLAEEREERRRTISERVEKAAELVLSHDRPTLIWCELNDEGKELTKAIPESVEVYGSLSDEAKEEALIGFANKQIKRLVIKTKIGAWGLNYQHCNDVVVFPDHSFERYYQAIRRCYRFGQTKPVTVHRVISECQIGTLESLKRKQTQAENMFASIVKHMNDSLSLSTNDRFLKQEEIPAWLSTISR